MVFKAHTNIRIYKIIKNIINFLKNDFERFEIVKNTFYSVLQCYIDIYPIQSIEIKPFYF